MRSKTVQVCSGLCFQAHLSDLFYRSLEYALDDIAFGTFFYYNPEELGHQAVTVLTKGDVVIWENRNFVDLQKKLPNGQRAALQHTKIQTSQITFLDVLQVDGIRFLVTGSATGQVHVFDMSMRLLWWYSIPKNSNTPFCGHIQRIAFDVFSNKKSFPDLVVMTSLGQIFHLSTSKDEAQEKIIEQQKAMKKKKKTDNWRVVLDPQQDLDTLYIQAATQCLLDFPFAVISCIMPSPVEPVLYVTGESGFLQSWNYVEKRTVNSIQVAVEEKIVKAFPKGSVVKKITKIPVTSLAVDGRGSTLVVSGKEPHCTYLIYDAQNFQLVQTLVQYPDYKVDTHITQMTFSPEGDYLAAMDSNHGTSVLKKRLDGSWVVLGKVNAHHAKVLSLMFIHKRVSEDKEVSREPVPTLYSLCEDGFAIEYNIRDSKIETGLVIAGVRQLETLFAPTCTALETEQREDEEYERISILMANSDFKIRTLNSDTLFVRKTCLGPGALYGTLKK